MSDRPPAAPLREDARARGVRALGSLRSAVAPFHAMEVLAAAGRLERAGRRVLHLELGQPSAPTPAPAREAAARLLADGRVGYTEALGRPSLRARIARSYAELYGLELDPERVCVTTGSSAGFLLAFLAAFDPGDRIAMPNPGYPAYRALLSTLGLEAVEIDAGAGSGWRVTADSIAAAHAATPLKGVLVMSPANPTGVGLDRAEFRRIAEVCGRLGLRLVSDEIYHRLDYGTPATTAAALSADAIVVNSFSKYYCMTGWRVGWLVVPRDLVRAVERLAQNLFISAPALSQVAAEAAFEAVDELEAVKRRYADARQRLAEGVPALGLPPPAPMDGAFYAYLDVGRVTNESMAFCAALLEATGVAATPGVDFDPRNGHRAVRLSFAGGPEVVAEAMDRLGAFLRQPPAR